MFKNPFFYGERGCLWVALDCVLALYAVICLIVDEHTGLAWSILAADALNITIRIIGRLVNRKRYYREDSFWLRKDDSNDIPNKTGDGLREP